MSNPEFPWVAPAACLAHDPLGPGPFTAVEEPHVIRFVDAHGVTVLVLADSYADIFYFTGSPPGILKGPRD